MKDELEKKCWMCKEVKPLGEFYKEISRPDGFSNRCKTCDGVKVKKLASYPEYHRKKQARYRAKYPERQKAREEAERLYGTKHFGLCSVCGKDKDLELHHEDYEKSLEVVAVCKECHYQLDINRI